MNEAAKKSIDSELTKINKSMLLNWLYSSPKEVEVEELGKWITDKTNGKYILIKSDN